MIKDFENRVAMHLRSMEKHELVLIADGKVQAYYLKEPGTRMMCVLILFTPEGIAIQGDFTPERNGSASAIGYGRDWFAGHLSPSYLCEKFLTKKWSQEAALEELRDPASYWREEQEDETLEQLDELASDLENGSATEQTIYDVLTDIGFDCCDGLPGYGYDPNEAAVLVAIQRKFAELWAKREPYYYIFSEKHSRDICLWWRPNSCGYTSYLDEAGRYSEAAIKEICDGTDNIAVPCDVASKWAKLTLSLQYKKGMLAAAMPAEF